MCNTTGATSKAETADPSGASEFIPGLSGVSDASPFLFCVVVCGPLFVFPFYYFPSCEFECCSWQGALDALLCDKIC